MRKTLAISLIFIYVALFGGFKLSLHFCGDSLTEYSIYTSSVEEDSCCSHHAHKNCSNQHVAKKMSCCEDKAIFLYSDVNTTIEAYKIVSPSVVVKKLKFNSLEKISVSIPNYYQSNAPPTIQGRAVYQLNSSYTLYG